MKHFFSLLISILFITIGFSQSKNDANVLDVLLSKYYAKEKVIVKNRLQLLKLYCQKVPNNEELKFVVKKNDVLKKNSPQILKTININLNESWEKDLTTVFNSNEILKTKVNQCFSAEYFKENITKAVQNNQRFLLINKPIFFGKNYCLVKIAFFRNNEHNYACYHILEFKDNNWQIIDTLDEWET